MSGVFDRLPKWEHDCDDCIFIGGVRFAKATCKHGELVDLDFYVCKNSIFAGNPSFVCRTGSKSEEYSSFPRMVFEKNHEVSEGLPLWMKVFVFENKLLLSPNASKDYPFLVEQAKDGGIVMVCSPLASSQFKHAFVNTVRRISFEFSGCVFDTTMINEAKRRLEYDLESLESSGALKDSFVPYRNLH